MFILGGNSGLQSLKFDVFVHFLPDSTGSLTLVLADMLSPEKELPIEVADLYVIVISDGAFASLC